MLADLDRQLDPLRKELAAIDGAAREKILAARARGEAVAVEPPKPLARWEFDSDFNDSIHHSPGQQL